MIYFSFQSQENILYFFHRLRPNKHVTLKLNLEFYIIIKQKLVISTILQGIYYVSQKDSCIKQARVWKYHLKVKSLIVFAFQLFFLGVTDTKVTNSVLYEFSTLNRIRKRKTLFFIYKAHNFINKSII